MSGNNEQIANGVIRIKENWSLVTDADEEVRLALRHNTLHTFLNITFIHRYS